jgi:N-acetylmuramoyl-L-alanine amidase
MVLANPFRLVVDLRGTVMGSGGMSSRDVGQAGVSRIRWAQFRRDPPITRVVFDLSGKPEYSVETTAEGPVVTVQAAP